MWRAMRSVCVLYRRVYSTNKERILIVNYNMSVARRMTSYLPKRGIGGGIAQNVLDNLVISAGLGNNAVTITFLDNKHC